MKEKKIGFKITMARKLLGLSQISLAEKLGVSRQTLSYWENGAAIPRIQQLEKLAKILKQDLNYFLEEEPVTAASISNIFNNVATPKNISVKEANGPVAPSKTPPVTAIAHAGVVIFTDSYATPSQKYHTQFTVKAAEDSPYFKNGDQLIFDTKALPQNGSLVLIEENNTYKITAYKKFLHGKLIAVAIFKSL